MLEKQDKIFSYGMTLILVFFVFLAGCITISPKYCEDTICGYEPSQLDIYSACSESSMPPRGYTFCSGKDCESQFNKNFKHDFQNFEPILKTMISNSSSSLVKSWDNANSSAKNILEVKELCPDLFNMILSGNIDKVMIKKKEFEKNISLFRDNYIDFHRMEIMSLYYLKTYLESENISFLLDRKISTHYQRLLNITNSYSMNINNDFVDFSNTMNSDVSFYKRYFYDDSKRVIDIFSNSSKYSECLLKNNNDTDFCYNTQNLESNLKTKQDLELFGSGFLAGSVGLSLFSYFGASSSSILAPIASYVYGGIHSGKWFVNFFNKMNNITSISDWKNMAYSKEMLEEFNYNYGPSSRFLLEYFDLMLKINEELGNIKTEIVNDRKNMLAKISEYEKNINKVEIYSSKYPSIINSAGIQITYLEDIERIKYKLKMIDNYTIGKSIAEIKIINESLNKIESYDKLNIKLINYCNETIEKKDVFSVELIDLKNNYLKQKTDESKLATCDEFFRKYSADDDLSCSSKINMINKSFDLKYGTQNCDLSLENAKKEIKNDDKFLFLKDKIKLLDLEFSYLKKSFENSCVSYDSFFSHESNYYSLKNIYNNLFEKGYDSYIDNINKLISKMDLENKKAISCLLEKNYYIDYNNLSFSLPFSKDTSITLNLPVAEFISNIFVKECLKSFEIKDKYITLNFSCINEEMSYDIIFSKPNFESSIKLKHATLYLGEFLQVLCYPNIKENQIVSDVIFDYDKIIKISVFANGREIDNSFDDKFITIFNNFTSNKKQCFDIYYSIKEPLNFSYDVFLEDDGTNTIYNYIFKIKNLIQYNLTNVYISIPNEFGLIGDYKIYDETLKESKLRSVGDEMFFILDSISINESKTFNFKITREFSDLGFDDDVRKIYSDLNIIIKNPDLELQRRNLLNNLDTLIKSNKSDKEKLKDIKILKLDVEKFLQKVSAETLIMNNFDDLKFKVQILGDDLISYFERLKKLTPFSNDLILDVDYRSVISSAEREKDSKLAIKILNDYINKKSLDSMIKKINTDIYNEFDKTFKIIKKENELYILDIDYKSQKERVEFYLKNDNLSYSVEYLEAFYNLFIDFNNDYDQLIKNNQINFNNSVNELSSMDVMLLRDLFAKLEFNLNSKHFDLVKAMGFDLKLSKSLINSFETELVYLETQKQKSLNVSQMSNFEIRYNKLKINLEDNINYLRNLATQEIKDMSVKVSSENKSLAINSFNNSQYVDSIFYAKNIFEDSKSKDYLYLVYAVLFFIIIGFLVYKFKDFLIDRKPPKREFRTIESFKY